MLKSKTIQEISEEVYRKHPDVQGVKPRVKERQGSTSDGYVLIYKTTVSGPGGKKINRIVRAVVTDKGKIKKISTSK
jgi:hypothetical protein